MSRLKIEKTLIIVLGVLLLMFYFIMRQKISLSSDSTTMLPMAHDLIKGNILLKGWICGTCNFIFTEVIFYCIGLLAGVSNYFLVTRIPLIFWVALCVLSWFVFVETEGMEQNYIEYIIVSLLYFAIIGLVPINATYTLLNANSHNNLYFFLVAAYYFAIKFLDTGKTTYIGMYGMLLFFMIFSEDVTIMVLVLPILCLCAILWFREHLVKERTYIFLAITSVIVSISGKLVVNALSKLGGLETLGLPMQFVHPCQWINRIIAFLPQLNILYGSDIQVHDWISMLFACSLFVIQLIGLMSFIYALIFYRKLSNRDLILLLVVIMNVVGCVCVNVTVFHRYIVPTYFFGSLLAVKLIYKSLCLAQGRTKYLYYSLAFFVIVILFLAKGLMWVNASNAEDAQRKVSEVIVAQNMGHGYGDFWCSSVISFYNNFENKVYPIICSQNRIVSFPFLIKKSWYQEKNKHYIITYNDRKSDFIQTECVEKLLGNPDKIIDSGIYRINYWKKDIALSELY